MLPLSLLGRTSAKVRYVSKNLRLNARRQILLQALIGSVAAGSGTLSYGQTTYDYIGSNGGSWIRSSNWSGGVSGKSPGVDNNANTTVDGATTDVAAFLTSSSVTSVGINFNSGTGSGSGTNGAANQALQLGAITFATGANAGNFLISNSSTTLDGVLTLNGVIVAGIDNVILRNASGGFLTLSGVEGSNKLMGLALGNATNNVVVIDGTGNIAISSIISGAGRKLTLQGTGTGVLNLSGANTYTGGTNINAGTLTYLNTTARPTTGTTTVAAGATLGLGVAASGSFFTSANVDSLFAGTLSGVTNDLNSNVGIDTSSASFTYASSVASTTRGLTKLGANTLTLSGTNSYTGGTKINAGTLSISNANALGSTGTISFGGGTLQYGTGVTADLSSRFSTADNQFISIDTNSQNVILATNLTSTGGTVTKLGAGTLTLAGANAYTGGTRINAGTLSISNASALGTTGTISFGGGTLQFTTGVTPDLSARFSTAASQSFRFDTNGQSVTLASVLASSSGTLRKLGAGTLTVTNANTYTGATNVDVGVLNVQNATGLGTTAGGVTVASGAALELQGGITIGAEALTIIGSGISGGGALRNVSGINSYGGTVTLGSGGARIAVDSGTLTLSGGFIAASGANPLEKTGSGTLILSTTASSGSFTGITTISEGTLQLNSGGSIVGSSIVNNGSFVVNRGAATTQAANFGLVSGTGSLTQSGASTATTLSLANTYSGGTFVGLNSGVLSLANVNAIQNSTLDTGPAGTQSVAFTVSGPNTYNIGGLAGDDALSIGANTIRVGSNGSNTTYNGVLSGTGGGLIKTGSGTLTLSVTNTYTGTTTISGGGTISARFGDSLGATPVAFAAAHLTLDNGTIQYYGGTGTTSLSSNRGVTIGAGNGTIDVVESTRTIVNASIVTGVGGLTKTGLGTLTLSNANAYGGGTTISGGTLLVNNTTGSGTGTGPVTVQSGATLGGSGSVAGSVTVNGTLTGTGSYGATTIAANGILTPGTSPGNVSFTSLTMADDSVFNWELEGNSVATGFDTVTVSGALAIGSVATGSVKSNLTFGSGVLFGESFWLTDKTWTVFTSANRTFLDFEPITIASAPSFDFSKGSLSWVASGVGGVNLQFTAVPEPTSLVFGLGLGVAGIVAYRRRKAKVANPGASASA